ncbi:MAG TPA: hypothetical protein VK306_09645 [Acidimicrobiales bacterium]|nr:hypothetical protein [Acidimicrobiales bacterium]
MRFAVETWAPDYGAPVDAAVLDASTATVDLAVEALPDDWAPVDPGPVPPPRTVYFVDGVQRVDARVWVTGDDGTTRQGLCASWGAGAVRCDGRAQVVVAEVRRGVLCPGDGVEPILTMHGDYHPYPVPDGGGDPLGQALGRGRGDLEGRVAVEARAGTSCSAPMPVSVMVAAGAGTAAGWGAGTGSGSGGAGAPVGPVEPVGPAGVGPTGPGGVEVEDGVEADGIAGVGVPLGRADVRFDEDDLLVVDGPLGDRRHIPGAVGYVKAHHVSYLPPARQEVVTQLAAGQRTPLFATGAHRFRYSWYFRLPGPATHAWWGVVRCELSGELNRDDAVRVADRVTATLPRFASQPHNDARAPQNLHPIAGLERELRRRLGDPLLLERALRRAATPT